MGSDKDPSPLDAAYQRLKNARDTTDAEQDGSEEPADGDLPPLDAAYQRLEQARDDGSYTGRPGTGPGTGPPATSPAQGDGAPTGGPDLPDREAAGIPAPENPDPTVSTDGDEWRNFFEMVVNQGERGFRSRSQQMAAEEGISATLNQDAAPSPTGIQPEPEMSEKDKAKVRRKAAETIKRNAEELRKQDQTKAMERLQSAIETGEAGEVVNAVWENPEAAVGLSVQSSAMQPGVLAGTLLTGMATGGVGGALAGAAGANIVESRAAIVEEMKRRGVDLTNADEVQETLADPEFAKAARDRGAARGATIGAVDLATNLLTYGLGSTGLRPVAKGIIGMGAQTAGESASEAAAQVAAGEETNPAEILSEGLASGPQSVIELAATTAQGEPQPADQARRRARELVGEAPAEQQAAEDVYGDVNQRPYSDVERARLEQMLESAREEGLATEQQEIERELELRREAPVDPDQPQDADAGQQPNRPPEGQSQAARRADRAGEGRRRPRRDAGTPDDPLGAARRALEQARQAREATGGAADQTSRAADRLGVENVEEDPRPDIDARREEESAEPGSTDEGDGQQEMEGVMEESARTETRPEEQVEEEVQRLEQERQQAEQQVQQAEQELLTTLQDVDAEEIDRLAESTDDADVERLARMALEQREEQGTLEGLGRREQEDVTEPQTPDMFGGERNVSKAVQNAADKLKQRRAGLEAKQQEEVRAKQQAEDAKSQAREAQQDLSTEQAPQDPEQTTERDGETDTGEPRGATQGANPGRDDRAETGGPEGDVGQSGGPVQPGETRLRVSEPVPQVERDEEDAGEGVQEVETEEEMGDNGEGPAEEVASGPEGQVEVRAGTPDGTERVATGTLTDDALIVEDAQTPEAIGLMAEEAARRDVALETGQEVAPEQAEAIMQLAEQGYEVRRAPDVERGPGGTYRSESGPALTVQAPQLDPGAPTLETDGGYTVGRALRPVQRKTTRSERPQGRMTDRPVEELEQELADAQERGDTEYAQQVQEALRTIRSQSRQTTYSHKQGDVVVTNPDGKLVDRRSPAYDDAVVEYFVENEEALREGTVEPAPSDDYGARAALQSSSPQQVLDAYNVARQAEEDVQEAGSEADLRNQLIRDKARYQTESFRGMAGQSAVADGGALRMNWLSENGKPLDAAAQEISGESGIDTTPQDIVDYILDNPTKSTRSVVDELREYFGELTGVNLTPELAQEIKDAQREDIGTDPADDLDAPFMSVNDEGPAGDATILEAILLRLTGDMQIPSAAVTVVRTASELTGTAQELYQRGMETAGDGQLRPAFFVPGEAGGQVYLIADQIAQIAARDGFGYETVARMTLMHEATTHQGLRAMLGDNFNEAMDLLVQAVGTSTVANARTVDGTRLVDANADKMEMKDGALTDESKRILMEEYLARVAEGMAIPNSTMETLYQGLKTQMAKALNLRLTKSELAVLLNASQAHLRGLQEGRRPGGSHFSALQDEQHPSRWMVLGTAAEDYDKALEQDLFDDVGPDVAGVFEGPYDGMKRFEIDDSQAKFPPNTPFHRLASAIRDRWDAKSQLKEASAMEASEEKFGRLEEQTRRRSEAAAAIEEAKEELRTGVPLQEVFSHRTLYEQYPDLFDDVEVQLLDIPHYGFMQHEKGQLVLGEKALGDVEQAVLEGEENMQIALSQIQKVMIHELQHFVQFEEGFAIGSNPQEFQENARDQIGAAIDAASDYLLLEDAQKVLEAFERDDLDPGSMTDQEALKEMGARFAFNDPYDVLTRMRVADMSAAKAEQERLGAAEVMEVAGIDTDDRQQVKEMARMTRDSDGFPKMVNQRAHNMYWRTAGEIEARIAQERRNWSIARRQKEGFYEDVEVAYDPTDVITRFSTYSEDPDQQELFMGTEGDQDLVVAHNLSERNLRWAAEKMDAYIPVPSIAVANYNQGYARFGKLSLVADKDMVDPSKGVPVYDGDIWSPTSPDAQYNHDPEGVGEVLGELMPYFNRVGEDSVPRRIDHLARDNDERSSVRAELARSNAVKLRFLEEQHDRSVEIPMKQTGGADGQLLRSEPMQAFLEKHESEDVELDKEVALDNPHGQVAEDLKAALQEAARRRSRSKLGQVDEEFTDAITARFTSDDGTLNFGPINQLFNKLSDIREQEQKVATYELKERLNEALMEETGAEKGRDAIDPYAERLADRMFGDPYIEDPQTGEAMTPSLDNLVQYLTGQNVQAAEEGMLPTLANARAAGAEPFESVAQMRDQQGRLVSEETFEQVKEEINNEWEALRGQLSNYHVGGRRSQRDFGRSMDARKDATKAMAEMMERRLSTSQAQTALEMHNYQDVPQRLLKEFVAFGKQLQESPTQYFEAKPQRAVSLEEFTAAVVPNTASEDVKEILGEYVERVVEYEDGDLGDRQQALAEASEGVRFQTLSPEQMGERFMSVNGGEKAQMDVRENLIALHNMRAEAVDWIMDTMDGYIPAPSMAIAKAQSDEEYRVQIPAEYTDTGNPFTKTFEVGPDQDPVEAFLASTIGDASSLEEWADAQDIPTGEIEFEVAGQAQGFTKFGNVSLVAPPSVIDPEDTPVFGSDAYTPTTSAANIRERVSEDTMRRLSERMDRIYETALRVFEGQDDVQLRLDQLLTRKRDNFTSRIQERNPRQAQSAAWARLLYADQAGMDVESIVEEAAIEAWEGPEYAMKERVFDGVVEDELNERFEGGRYASGAVGDWLESLDTERTVLDDSGERVEATPQAVADAMVRGGIRNYQGNLSTGPTRARTVPNFESLEELKSARSRVIGPEGTFDMKESADSLLYDLGQELKGSITGSRSPKHDAAELIKAMGEELNARDRSPTTQEVTDLIADATTEDVGRLRMEAQRDVDTEDRTEARRAADQAAEAFATGEKDVDFLLAEQRFEYDTVRDLLSGEERRWLRRMVVSTWEQGINQASEFSLWQNKLLDSLNDRVGELANEGLDLEIQQETDQANERFDRSEELQQLRNAIDDASFVGTKVNPNTQAAWRQWNEFLEARDEYQELYGEVRQKEKAEQKLEELRQSAELAIETFDSLSELETQYFEAKPARAVPIDAFETAIVPDTMEEERVQKLLDAGLQIREYSSEEERRQIQSEIDEARFLTRDFSEGGGSFAENADDVPLQRPENPSSLSDYWTWLKSHMRRLFTNRGDLPADVYEASEERRGQIKAWLQRTRWAVQDFRKAIEDTYGPAPLTEEQVQTVNEALGNGRRQHDVDQGSLFEDDPQIEEAVPASEFWFSAIPLTTEETLKNRTYIEDLPEPVQSATAELRGAIDAMSHAGIKSGLFRGKLKATVQENMGTYFTRSYKIHNEPEYGETLRQAARELDSEDSITMDPDQVPEDVPADAWNRAVGWFRQNHPHMSDEQIQGRLLELLNQEQNVDTSGGQLLGDVGQEIYQRRKEIPEELRALLGEYEDPATNFQKTMVKMSHAVANQNLLNKVKKAGVGRFLFEEPRVIDGVSYEVQIGGDSQTMKPLANLYTTPEIAQAFREFDVQESMPAWQEALMTLSVGAKTVKTVGSVKTQFRNYYGNILFALAQGHLFSPTVGAGAAAGAAAGGALGGGIGAVPGAAVGTIAGLSTQSPKQKAWSMAIASMKQDFASEEQRQEFQRMLELGVVGDAVRAGELEDLFRDLDLDLEDPKTGMGELADKIVGTTGQTLAKLYQLGDEIWKVYAFQIEKERYAGAKPDWPEQRVEEYAAERVKNSYPTYSQVPEALKKLRRLPTNAPFVSFFSEVFRTTYHSFRFIKEDLQDPDTRHIGMQRAAGMVMAQGAMKGLYEVSKALTGFDDEDDEYLRRLLPEWSQYSNIFHLNAEDGKASYVDLGYLNPYKAYGEAAIAAMQGDDVDPWRAAGTALSRLLSPFISEEILSKKVREAIVNRSTDSGAPIANPALKQTKPAEFWGQRVAHILSTFEPSTSKDVRGAWNAFFDKGLYQDGDPTQEIMSLFAGQRIKTIDMAERIKWETLDFEEQYRNASQLFSSTLTKRGTVSASDIEEAYRESVEAKSNIIDHMSRDVQAAINFGLSPRQAFAVLRTNNVGKDRAIQVMAGQYVPRPSENVLKSRIEAARTEGRTEDAQLLMRRRRMAVEAQKKVQQEFIERHPSLRSKFKEVRELLQSSE